MCLRAREDDVKQILILKKYMHKNAKQKNKRKGYDSISYKRYKEKMKTKNKRNYLKEKGITLIALVVTIVVLLILAGVTINTLFGDSGIIQKAQDAQNRMNNAQESDLNALNDLDKWINNQVNGTEGGNTTGDDDSPSTTPKISTLVGKVVDKNTRAEDAYGNKITIPKGFKILQHGAEAGSATYTYSGDNIPAVQDGIVIEHGTDKNQFVWVPVGTINNKAGDSRGATSIITLGRYSDFTMTNGAVASGQPVQVASVENCTQIVTISYYRRLLPRIKYIKSRKFSNKCNSRKCNSKKFRRIYINNISKWGILYSKI